MGSFLTGSVLLVLYIYKQQFNSRSTRHFAFIYDFQQFVNKIKNSFSNNLRVRNPTSASLLSSIICGFSMQEEYTIANSPPSNLPRLSITEGDEHLDLYKYCSNTLFFLLFRLINTQTTSLCVTYPFVYFKSLSLVLFCIGNDCWPI